MNQYTQPPTEGTIPVPPPPVTVSPEQRRIEALESKISDQGKELLKLRRDIGRLRNDIGDIINTIKSRG